MQAQACSAYRRLPTAKIPLLAAALVAALLAGTAGSLLLGDVPIDTATACDALCRYDAQLTAHVIVRDWRLPRALADLLVGASLAVAGAIMQAVTRNPLASPGIMGLNRGASFAVVLGLVWLPALGRPELMLLSIAGATLGAALVYGLGTLSRGGLTPVRLALTGIAVSALLGSVGNGLKIYYEMRQDMLFWFARGTEGVQWADLALAVPLGLVGLLGAVALAPAIGVFSLGEQVARGLGQRTARTRLLASAIVLVLSGGAVSLAGPVGFVGLMVPHLARQLFGLDNRKVIPACALGGALLMLAADVGARLAATPCKTPVPVGVVTALAGVPFFLMLVCRRPHGMREGRA